MILVYLNSNNMYGGVEMIGHRFANYLRARGINFIIAEEKNSRISHLHQDRIVDPKDLHLISDEVSHIFLPSFSKVRTIGDNFKYFKNSKVFGWIVHPNDPFRSFFPYSAKPIELLGYKGIRPLQYLMWMHTRYVRNLFEEATSAKGIATMDGATSRSLKYFFPDLSRNPPILPIPSPSASSIEVPSTRSDSLRIGYLGRLEKFKMSALKPFILDCAKAGKFTLHLVGEGDGAAEIDELCRSLGVELINYGFRNNKEAKEILRRNTDFCCAMGTSALDLAGEGIPCVIIDPAIKLNAPPQKRYRFVHEIKDFTLGEYRDFDRYQHANHSLNDIYHIVKTDSNLRMKEWRYVKDNHNPDKIFDRLLDFIYKAEFTGECVARLMRDVNASFDRLKLKKRDEKKDPYSK